MYNQPVVFLNTFGINISENRKRERESPHSFFWFNSTPWNQFIPVYQLYLLRANLSLISVPLTSNTSYTWHTYIHISDRRLTDHAGLSNTVTRILKWKIIFSFSRHFLKLKKESFDSFLLGVSHLWNSASFSFVWALMGSDTHLGTGWDKGDYTRHLHRMPSQTWWCMRGNCEPHLWMFLSVMYRAFDCVNPRWSPRAPVHKILHVAVKPLLVKLQQFCI